MSSFFERIFPRGVTKRTETVPDIKVPQPSENEPKDPLNEAIRLQIKANHTIHSYGYEEELDSYALYITQHPDHVRRIRRNPVVAEQEKDYDKELIVEQKGNPNEMWSYGILGALFGLSIAMGLMRKHVEPLTSVVYTSLGGLGGYGGAKLSQSGLVDKYPIYQTIFPPPPPPVINKREKKHIV